MDAIEEKTGTDKDEEWEEVKEGESAENGAPETQADTDMLPQNDTDAGQLAKIE